MRFTRSQYEDAIAAIESARTQLEPDGKPCAVCADTGHQAWECALLAMAMCEEIAKNSEQLHETLHKLAGDDMHMGYRTGPARIVLP